MATKSTHQNFDDGSECTRIDSREHDLRKIRQSADANWTTGHHFSFTINSQLKRCTNRRKIWGRPSREAAGHKVAFNKKLSPFQPESLPSKTEQPNVADQQPPPPALFPPLYKPFGFVRVVRTSCMPTSVGINEPLPPVGVKLRRHSTSPLGPRTTAVISLMSTSGDKYSILKLA